MERGGKMGTIFFGNEDITRYRYGPPCRLANRCQVVQHQAAYDEINTIAVIVICLYQVCLSRGTP